MKAIRSAAEAMKKAAADRQAAERCKPNQQQASQQAKQNQQAAAQVRRSRRSSDLR